MNPPPPSTLPHLSRRSFLGLGAATAGAVLLSACGTADTATTAATAPATAAGCGRCSPVAAPRRGPRPAQDQPVRRRRPINALYDKLVEYGDDLGPVPRLATSWQPNADATIWTVELRPARFHDGRPVRAADVLYSYRRILDPANALRPRASLEVIDIARSRQIDNLTIEFVCSRPCGDLANVLAAFGAYIIPEGCHGLHQADRIRAVHVHLLRSGTILRRTAVHRLLGRRTHVETLEILTAPDETARINALLGGQVEYADDLSVTSARTYQADSRVQILRSPRSSMSGFAMKVDRPPFDSRDLRRAMFALVDREELVTTVLGGTGVVGNNPAFRQDTKYCASDLPQRSLDLDEAKALIERPAPQNTTTIELQTTGSTNGFVEGREHPLVGSTGRTG